MSGGLRRFRLVWLFWLGLALGLAGCVQSRQVRYRDHLSTVVQPSTTALADSDFDPSVPKSR